MSNNAPNIKRFIPKHYNREYPLFVEFLNSYFKYVHRTQNATPEEYLKRVERLGELGYSKQRSESLTDVIARLRPPSEFSDQSAITTKEREYTRVETDGYILCAEGSEKLEFVPDNRVELEMMFQDRGFSDFFDELGGGLRSIDAIRFYKLLKEMKSMAGSRKVIELFFSWLHEGEIITEYPRFKISTLDENFIPDGDNYLRDDYYYSEFSYVVKAYGKAKVSEPEAFYELYRKHFHPAGFGYFLEDRIQEDLRPFNFPVLVPSGVVGSYYKLNAPITLENGDILAIRCWFPDSAGTEIYGPLFQGVEITNKVQYDIELWDVWLDGEVLDNEDILEIDNNFHELVFKYRGSGSFTIENFLKPELETEDSGRLPITRIRKFVDNVAELDYRINTLSETGVASAHTPFEMLTQLQGLYKFESAEVYEITETLEPETWYMVFVNGSNTESGSVNVTLGSAGAEQEVINFEYSAERIRRFAQDILLNSLNKDGGLNDYGVVDSVDINLSTRADFGPKKTAWYFFKTGSTPTKVIASNLGGLEALQFVVWKVDQNILTFERTHQENFYDTGYWVKDPSTYSYEELEDLTFKIAKVEALINLFDRIVNIDLPKTEGLEKTVSLIEADSLDLRSIILETLVGALGEDDPLVLEMAQFENSTTTLDDYVNTVLPNALNQIIE